MRLLFFSCLAAIQFAIAFAQQPKESVPPLVRGPREDPSRVVHELEVSPAEEPRPAMKYRLLPNPADLKPGNAATQYYKAYALDSRLPFHTEAYEKLEAMMELPPGAIDINALGLTLEQLRDEVFYRSIRAATSRATCDWEEPLEEEGVHLLLPAMQSLRSVGRLLSMKARYEIARGNFDEALLTARDNLTLSQHLQREGETIVQSLVGIAIAGLAHEHILLEWIRAPGSPNLYWALSEVPPYIDSRKVINGDLRFPEHTLPALREIDQRALTVDEALGLATRAFAVENESRLVDDDLKGRAQLAAWALQAYDESHYELTTSGVSRELLDRMPVLQVALLGRWRRYQEARDDLYKWAAIAYGPGRELALRKQDEIRQKSRNSTVPFNAFLPPLRPMYQAQLRQHRFFSVLRAIEAMRMYAARHGKWPAALSDVHEVPVPNDPTTGAPFVYQISGNNAILTMVEHRLSSGMEYEYRLRLREASNGK
jgi:tetratricopeptide (TPR) repeat protein